MCDACQAAGGQIVVLEQSVGALHCEGDTAAAADIREEDFCAPPYCGDDIVTELPDGATDPSPADLLVPAQGEHEATLTWFPEGIAGLTAAEPSPGATTTVSLRVEPQSSVRRVRQEVVIPETDGVPDHEPGGWSCPDRLEADASFSLTTVDGRLDETYTGRLVLGLVPPEIPEQPTPHATLDIDGLPAGIVAIPASTHEVDFTRLDLAFDLDAGRGTIRILLKPQQGAAAEPADVLLAAW